MPIEEYGEEGLTKIPNLDLAQALFTLQTTHTSDQEKNEAKSMLESQITENCESLCYLLATSLLFVLLFCFVHV